MYYLIGINEFGAIFILIDGLFNDWSKNFIVVVFLGKTLDGVIIALHKDFMILNYLEEVLEVYVAGQHYDIKSS